MTETGSPISPASTGDHYVAQYDRLDDEPLSVAVADAIATFVGVDVIDLEPLHYSINADALERLFEPRANGLRSSGTVTFEHEGCLVMVTAEGEIQVGTAREK